MGLKIMPRLQTSEEVKTEQSLIKGTYSPTRWRNLLDATAMSPVLLALSLSMLDVVQFFMLWRQLMSDYSLVLLGKLVGREAVIWES